MFYNYLVRITKFSPIDWCRVCYFLNGSIYFYRLLLQTRKLATFPVNILLKDFYLSSFPLVSRIESRSRLTMKNLPEVSHLVSLRELQVIHMGQRGAMTVTWARVSMLLFIKPRALVRNPDTKLQISVNIFHNILINKMREWVWEFTSLQSSLFWKGLRFSFSFKVHSVSEKRRNGELLLLIL